MKKTIIITALISINALSNAQNPKYVAAMEKNVAGLDSIRSTEKLQGLANTFERISSAEKKEWLPLYYAAYCYVNMTYNVKGATIDTYCDKAETFINKADSINPNNSEIYTLKAQITSARISVNPMIRGQKYGPQAGTLRAKAKELDATNPRPYYLDGTAAFYTPPAFGGGKDKAKAAFEKAKSLFETFKPASSIAPNWGKGATDYFLKECDSK